jgi:hypothetical protein
MTKITQEELEALVLEEIENLDEGVWGRMKARGAGAMAAMSGLPGDRGQSYNRAKASSILKNHGIKILQTRKKFETDFKKTMGGVPTNMRSEYANVRQAFNDLSTKLQRMAQEIKILTE